MDVDLWPGGGKYCGLFEIDFGLKDGDRILDVGGGHKPFPLSTHVCDMVESNEQRHHQRLNLGDREFIEGPAEHALAQYPDNYFDFCYTNHTLEHIDDLGAALDQISRVCKRGFNAFPASDFEFMTAKSHFGHVNLIRVINGAIHFCRRPPHTICDAFGYAFEQKLFNDGEFKKLWESHGCRGLRHIWEGRMYWTGRIEWKFYDGEKAFDLFPQLRYFVQEKGRPGPASQRIG